MFMRACMYVFVRACVSACVCVYPCICLCMRACMYVCMSVCLCVCVCVDGRWRTPWLCLRLTSRLLFVSSCLTSRRRHSTVSTPSSHAPSPRSCCPSPQPAPAPLSPTSSRTSAPTRCVHPLAVAGAGGGRAAPHTLHARVCPPRGAGLQACVRSNVAAGTRRMHALAVPRNGCRVHFADACCKRSVQCAHLVRGHQASPAGTVRLRVSVRTCCIACVCE